MSDNASGNSTELAMARDVTGNSADDSPNPSLEQLQAKQQVR
jgi:hypothetical protein